MYLSFVKDAEDSPHTHLGARHMPYVNFKLTPEGLTEEKKKKLIASVTELLQVELGKNPETTIVIIEEVETDNWGIGGRSVTDRRKETPS